MGSVRTGVGIGCGLFLFRAIWGVLMIVGLLVGGTLLMAHIQRENARPHPSQVQQVNR